MGNFNQILKQQLKKRKVQHSRTPFKTSLEGVLEKCNLWLGADKTFNYKLETYSGDVPLTIKNKHKKFVEDHIWEPVKVIGTYDRDGIAFKVEKIVLTYGGEDLFLEPYLEDYAFDDSYYNSTISKTGKLEPTEDGIAC